MKLSFLGGWACKEGESASVGGIRLSSFPGVSWNLLFLIGLRLFSLLSKMFALDTSLLMPRLFVLQKSTISKVLLTYQVLRADELYHDIRPWLQDQVTSSWTSLLSLVDDVKYPFCSSNSSTAAWWHSLYLIYEALSQTALTSLFG